MTVRSVGCSDVEVRPAVSSNVPDGRPFEYDEALGPFLVRLGLGDRLKGLLEADVVEIDDLIYAPDVELLAAGFTRIQVSRLRRHSHDLGNSCSGWEVLEAFLRTARLDCKPPLLGIGLWEPADLVEATDDEILAAGGPLAGTAPQAAS
jgi:hypothetical protein